jgi:hypothetical protein
MVRERETGCGLQQQRTYRPWLSARIMISFWRRASFLLSVEFEHMRLQESAGALSPHRQIAKRPRKAFEGRRGCFPPLFSLSTGKAEG